MKIVNFVTEGTPPIVGQSVRIAINVDDPVVLNDDARHAPDTRRTRRTL